MRLFHVSEESNIEVFNPIKPYRIDMQESPPLVWAINEKCLSNFMTPRDCPRVTFHTDGDRREDDLMRYFSSTSSQHVVAIESIWYERMKNTTLYIYEFDVSAFYLQDNNAGYYVSEEVQKPIGKRVVSDLFAELFNQNVEVRILDNLMALQSDIKKTSLKWSMCRMGNAKTLEASK